MVNSYLKLLPAIALAAHVAADGANAVRQRDLPISLDAASSQVDYAKNQVLFRQVVISQGAIRVQADQARATGLNFENSTWTFTGNVRIRVEGGGLKSDEAKVEFRDKLINKATITGSPAEFEQDRKLGSAEQARGRAGLIVYDVPAGTVRLTKDAWLTDGRSDITGRELVYDVRAQRVQAQAEQGTDDRVRITIRPKPEAPAEKTP